MDHGAFGRIARASADAAGSPWATATAVASVAIWAALGPHFRFSETWQLVINTSTTIVTFLMVFLIQHTQNRDSLEIHMKLNELIRTSTSARNEFITLEDRSDAELAEFQAELRALARKYRMEPAVERSGLAGSGRAGADDRAAEDCAPEGRAGREAARHG